MTMFNMSLKSRNHQNDFITSVLWTTSSQNTTDSVRMQNLKDGILLIDRLQNLENSRWNVFPHSETEETTMYFTVFSYLFLVSSNKFDLYCQPFFQHNDVIWVHVFNSSFPASILMLQKDDINDWPFLSSLVHLTKNWKTLLILIVNM